MKRRKNTEKAVSEIVGTALLLGIAIALFAIVQLLAFSFPDNPTTPLIDLGGSLDKNGEIIIEHQGGKSISLDAEIITIIDDVRSTEIARNVITDSNGNDQWDIGEVVKDPTQRSIVINGATQALGREGYNHTI